MDKVTESSQVLNYLKKTEVKQKMIGSLKILAYLEWEPWLPLPEFKELVLAGV